jgi:NADH-quinone oxidoreductase subunit J
VLFVFVIMLLGPDAGALGKSPGRARISRLVSGVLLAVLALLTMVMLGRASSEPSALGSATPEHGSVEAVGGLLFTKAIIPFELATALLIVAVVGAIAVARARHVVKPLSQPVAEPRELFHGPLHPRDAEHPLPKEPVE